MPYRLFRHRPTGKWLPVIQGANQVTPGSAYIHDFAREYAVDEQDVEVVEPVDEIPSDFESKFVNRPARPPSRVEAARQALAARPDDAPVTPADIMHILTVLGIR